MDGVKVALSSREITVELKCSRQEGVESPGACADYAAIFAWFLCTFGPPSLALVAEHPQRGGMPLHHAVGVNCKNGPTTEINAYVSSI